MTLASSHPVRIQICGALAVERDGQRLDALLPGRQGRLLFTYLVSTATATSHATSSPRPCGANPTLPRSMPGSTRCCPSYAGSSAPTAVDGRSALRLCLPDAWVDLEAAVEAIHRAESAVAQQDWTRAWGPALTALFVAERGLPSRRGRPLDR